MTIRVTTAAALKAYADLVAGVLMSFRYRNQTFADVNALTKELAGQSGIALTEREVGAVVDELKRRGVLEEV